MNELIISDAVTDSQIVSYKNERHNNPALSYLLRLRSKKSQKTMRSCLSTVVNILGWSEPLTFDWSTLTRDMVQVVIHKLLHDGKSPNTINLILCAIKGVAEEAHTSRSIDANTYNDIKTVRRVRGLRISRGRMLELPEIKRVFSFLDGRNTCSSIRDAAFISLMLGCGMRRAEVVELNMEDLDLVKSKVQIHGKGNKDRINYIPPATLQRLSAWIDNVRGDQNGALFTRIRKNDDVTSERITSNGIGYVIENIVLNLGVESFTPHDLRRTYASMLLENGEDLLTVKEALGHASVVTTQQYDKRGMKRLQDAAKKLTFGE